MRGFFKLVAFMLEFIHLASVLDVINGLVHIWINPVITMLMSLYQSYWPLWLTTSLINAIYLIFLKEKNLQKIKCSKSF